MGGATSSGVRGLKPQQNRPGLPFLNKKHSILVLGIDGAGKTTIINHTKGMSGRKAGEQPPTIGCSFEQLHHGHAQLTVIDMAGGSRYRNMWQNYYCDAEGIIFVVDSADAMRLAVAKEELMEMVAHPSLRNNVPLLILANKMDLPKSLNHQALAQALDLPSIPADHAWKVMHCCGLSGEGISEGWDWLVDRLNT